MDKPLISICIPTYNGQEFLEQCLDSCIGQNYDDYEIVICDDGSSDQTWSILERYSAKNKKIRLFKNPANLGLVGNWNKCLEAAKGEWIKFVFQDDYITRNCLERFVSAIEPGINLLVCARNFILPADATKEQITYYSEGVKTLENTTTQKNPHFSPGTITDIAMAHMAMNFIAEPSLTLFRKNVTERIGNFNAELRQICDLEFFLRLASNDGLKYLPEKLCAFRIHAGSTTSTNIGQKYYELRYIETLLYSYFLLYDPAFKNFRANLDLARKIKLQIYFRVKAYNAYKTGLLEKRDHPLFQKAGKFPKIYKVRNGNLFIRLIALVKK